MQTPRCPKCRDRLLDPLDDHGIQIDVCVGCGGLWFDPGELATALQRYDPELAPSGRVVDGLGEPVECDGCRCPRCKGTLRAHELSVANHVVVDACGHCGGVWLDHGELTRAQAGHHEQQALEAIERPPTWAHWLFQFFSKLPVEFNFQPRRRPVVTWALIALNVACFLPLLLVSTEDLASLVTALALFPERVGQVQWAASLVSSLFLHGGVLHILSNMYFLWILGDNLEDVLGPRRFLLFYLLAGLASSLATTFSFLDPEIPRIGASGAVSGVMAAYAMFFRRSKLTFMLFVFQFKVPTLVYVAIWIALNLIGLAVGVKGIDWVGHLGGLTGGAVMALLLYRRVVSKDALLRLLNGEADAVDHTATPDQPVTALPGQSRE